MFQIKVGKFWKKKMLVGCNLDVMKITLRQRLCYFKMTLPQVLQKVSPHSSAVTLSHTIESITNGSVG